MKPLLSFSFSQCNVILSSNICASQLGNSSIDRLNRAKNKGHNLPKPIATYIYNRPMCIIISIF